MVHLCSVKPGKRSYSQAEASKVVAKELSDNWTSKNVYPIYERNIANKIKADYGTFNELLKQQKNSKHKKSDAWYRKVNEFNTRMTKNAYDVRTHDKVYQKKLEEFYSVKMTDEDERFYMDNCFGSYSALCQPSVSKKWAKQERRLAEREASIEKKRTQKRDDLANEKLARSLAYDDAVSIETEYAGEVHDPDLEFLPIHTSPTPDNNVPPGVQTRADRTNELSSDKGEPIVPDFPQVPIRSSHKCIDERIIRCTTQCLADHKVSRNDVAGIIIKTANIIFGQNWTRHALLEDGEDDFSDSDSETDLEKAAENAKKRRKSAKDLTKVFPSNRSIDKYLEDASYLNLLMAAEYIVNKDDTDVVTVGLDDTTKAAGHRAFDVKTDHITITGPKKSRKTMTTGYQENVSHSGAEGAKAYEFKLKCLSILAECSVDELKTAIDFWITDRAGDCGTLLKELGIEFDKILKCCAHVILGIDHACDKVFKETEQKIGVQKLLDLSAGQKAFCSPSTSIHTLGQIAISKLLLPSHASHSISLFNEYTSWMEMQGIEKAGFRGFCANRFGRIAEIAREFIARRDSIMAFFEAIVDENANKLVMAVSTYIQNDWFVMCSDVC